MHVMCRACPMESTDDTGEWWCARFRRWTTACHADDDDGDWSEDCDAGEEIWQNGGRR